MVVVMMPSLTMHVSIYLPVEDGFLCGCLSTDLF